MRLKMHLLDQEEQVGRNVVGEGAPTRSSSTKDSAITRSSDISLEAPSQESCSSESETKTSWKLSGELPKGEGLKKKGESSEIYGEARGGGISFIGSWALRTCSDLAGRMSSTVKTDEAVEGRIGREERGRNLESVESLMGNGGGGGIPVREAGGGYQPWRFEVGTTFQIRVSHLLKFFIVWVLVMALTTLLFHGRIRDLEAGKRELEVERRQLEVERRELRGQVDVLTNRLNTVVQRVEDVVALIPPKSSFQSKLNEGDEDYDEDDLGEEDGPSVREERVKRSPGAGPGPRRSTKNLQYSRDSMTLNSLNNGTTSFDSMMDSGWTTRVTPIDSDRSGNKGPRAAYLQIDGVSIHIKKPKQLIGPWYMSNTGKDIGFAERDLWYDNLALDPNGTSVIFQEDGLFLIYAQVFYQLQQVHNANPTPMGYRIHLKKNGDRQGESKSFQKPIIIAECVPSFPTTIYQTCFTQVAWSVQAQDELYLEHFTESRPIIEAVSNGQTFLGIVRLSN